MKLSHLMAGTALSIAMSVGAAQAAPLLGTFAGAVSVDTPAALLNVGSTVILGAGIVTSTGTGDFSIVGLGDTISDISSPFTLTDGQMFGFTLDGVGEFSGTTSNVLLAPGSTVTNRSVRLYVLGAFDPFGPADSGPASVTGSLTQTGGAGSAISYSFTFASPPVPVEVEVPEPMSLALLGLGLAGLGVAMRRKA